MPPPLDWYVDVFFSLCLACVHLTTVLNNRSKGIDSLHRGICQAAISMVLLSKGREMIHNFAASDAAQCVATAGDRAPMECCLEPPVMHTNFLRDVPFKIIRKCMPLEVATECAFADYVMHLLVFRTFNKGHKLVDAARKKLLHIAGNERAVMLLDLVKACEDGICYTDLVSKVTFPCLSLCMQQRGPNP